MQKAFTFRFNLMKKSFQKKRAPILQGGWPGHRPEEVSKILAALLREEGFEVEISETLDVLLDRKTMQKTDLIIPNWTLGTIDEAQLDSLLQAVENGTGVAGMHGGMGDAFRCEIRYQLMTGGQFVAHPGDEHVTYTVHFTERDHPVTRGMRDFTVTTEQYYMLVDPANEVLAVSRFSEKFPPVVWREVVMPVVWTKKYGKGRVFYSSLGHSMDILKRPEVLTLMKRGMVWAARCDQIR